MGHMDHPSAIQDSRNIARRKDRKILRVRCSGVLLQLWSSEHDRFVASTNSQWLGLLLQDQAVKNPSSSGGGAYEAAHLVEELLTIDGGWREKADFL